MTKRLVEDADFIWAAISECRVKVLRIMQNRKIRGTVGKVQFFSNSFVKVNNQYYSRSSNEFIGYLEKF